MSVLMKGVQMPTSCLDCPIYDNYNYHCNLYSYGIPARYNYNPSKRPEWCELEELPEHHGRLIDADTLVAESLADGAYGYVDTKEIYVAPTIVEAE